MQVDNEWSGNHIVLPFSVFLSLAPVFPNPDPLYLKRSYTILDPKTGQNRSKYP